MSVLFAYRICSASWVRANWTDFGCITSKTIRQTGRVGSQFDLIRKENVIISCSSMHNDSNSFHETKKTRISRLERCQIGMLFIRAFFITDQRLTKNRSFLNSGRWQELNQWHGESGTEDEAIYHQCSLIVFRTWSNQWRQRQSYSGNWMEENISYANINGNWGRDKTDDLEKRLIFLVLVKSEPDQVSSRRNHQHNSFGELTIEKSFISLVSIASPRTPIELEHSSEWLRVENRTGWLRSNDSLSRGPVKFHPQYRWLVRGTVFPLEISKLKFWEIYRTLQFNIYKQVQLEFIPRG